MIPDVIFSTFNRTGNHRTEGFVRAVSGLDGEELFTIDASPYRVEAAGSIAAGDIDGDTLPEIIANHENGGLICFEHNGAFKWRSFIDRMSWGGASIADVDRNGTPEIIAGRYLLNADGTVRWEGTGWSGSNEMGPLSFAVDLDREGDLEIVAGGTVYRSDGSIWWSLDRDGFPAVGDFDDDAFPEVVLVSEGTVSLYEHTGDLIWGPYDHPGIEPPKERGGAPTVDDFDGDNRPEIGVAGEDLYVVFDTDGSILWQQPTKDDSGCTGSSVFDFEMDGRAEIVYADENYLYVFRGTDGSVLCRQPVGSGTTYEIPVIADVNNDGSAEIIVCSNNYYTHDSTGIEVYRDVSNSWVDTRGIWNQHAYHITNVNDDGTIPVHQLSPWEIYNNFRCQEEADPSNVIWAPDLTVGRIDILADPCTDEVYLSALVGNAGSAQAPAAISVSFYEGDPDAGGTFLVEGSTTRSLEAGEFEEISILWPNAIRGEVVTVFARVDDQAGTGIGVADECDEENNICSATEDIVPVDIIPPDDIGNLLRYGGYKTFTHASFHWHGAPPLEGGDHYHIYRSESKTGPFQLIEGHTYTSDEWTDEECYNKLYFYRVKAADGCENESGN